MSLSIDEPEDKGDDARRVLASWLDDFSAGRCARADMQESFLSVCRKNPDAPWDALALLDQYQRRGRIDAALARSLKADIAQLVFGVASQTEGQSEDQHDTTDVTIDTTGSRWRKLLAEREPDSINAERAAAETPEPRERAFVDPPVFRRDFDPPPSRPMPPLKANEDPAAATRVGSSAASSSDILRDRYELLSILGRGSTGTVYRALDRHRAHLPPADRCVAVKVLKLDYRDRPEALAQLEREVHQAQSLSHPNIVSIFDLDRDGSTYFIVMELLEGELLADILRKLDGQPMERESALAIISSVGAALAYAHQRDVVHADLKPRNIMITNSGELRVLDFGFALERSLDLHSASGLHEAPVVTPAYASVERVTGSVPHASDDVYSLACIAYELLSGRHPFGGRSALLARAHGRHPQRIPGLTHKQSHALQRALLWTRGERKIDIVELLADLGCAKAPNELMPPGVLSQPAKSRSGWMRALGAATVGVVAAVIVFGLWQLDVPKEILSALPVAPPPSEQAPTSDGARSEAPASTQSEEPVEAPAQTTASGSQPQAASTQRTQQTVPPKNQTASNNQPPKAVASAPATKLSSAPAAASAPATKSNSTSAAPSTPPRRDTTSSAAAEPSVIQFEKDTYVVNEGEGSVRLLVRRSGSTRNEVNFTWALRGNSATPGEDFAAIGPGIERIPPGAREASITIPLVNDSEKETTELFLVELMVDGAGVKLGERSSAAVIIVDDD